MSEDEFKDRAHARSRARRERRRREAEGPEVVETVRPRRTRQAAKAAAPRTEREAVIHANSAFYRSFEARDLVGMGDVWARETYVRCIHPGWEPLVGWEEVVGSWSQIFAGVQSLRFELSDMSVRMGGTMAWVELSERLEAIHEGKVARSQVLATNIFERQTDGTWRMVHHHASPVMVRQTTPQRGGEPIH